MSSSKHSYFAFFDDSFGDKAFSLKLPLTREEQPVYFLKQSLCSVSTHRRLLRACYLLDIWRFTEVLSRL